MGRTKIWPSSMTFTLDLPEEMFQMVHFIILQLVHTAFLRLLLYSLVEERKI